jgi:stage III sporulation protein SpoIIIAA
MDLGRLLRHRFPGRNVFGDQEMTAEDLQTTIDRVGNFGADNRAGIGRTLHHLGHPQPQGAHHWAHLPCKAGGLWAIEIIKILSW